MSLSIAPTTRFYQVHQRSEWMRAWVTDDGCLSIMSDFGNYAYWWTSPGKEIRRFLVETGVDYLTMKLSAGKREFDADETKEAIKDQIALLKKEHQIDAKQARDFWESAQEIRDEASARLWFHEIDQQHQEDFSLCYRSTYPQQLVQLMKVLWPKLVQVIRDELTREGLKKDAPSAVT